MADPRTALSGQSSVAWRVIEGDCREAMLNLPAQSVDAIVTDPPYGLGFMGQEWDSPGGLGDMPMRRNHATNTVNTGASRQGGRQRSTEDFAKRQLKDARAYQADCEEWAREALRVLKPGGFLLAMGGTRTYHRLAVGIEDAGFEVRDMLDWLYGTGFPKSLNLGDGRGTALKPGHEPICMARKSTVGTVAANVERYGTGALNIDACRIASGEAWEGDREPSTALNGYGPGDEDGWQGKWTKRSESHDAGRWPANVVLDEDAAAMLDEQSGQLVSGANPTRRGSDKFRSVYGDFEGQAECEAARGVDVGGASRFFYCAKPDQGERNVGLADRNPHPTVKPVELMRWLIRLVTPEGGTVLDPFAGSGTTGIAALREQRSFIGIERENTPERPYVDVARARILGDAPLLNLGTEVA